MAWLTHHLFLILFFVLAASLFCGFPVTFVPGGIAIMFVRLPSAPKSGRSQTLSFRCFFLRLTYTLPPYRRAI